MPCHKQMFSTTQSQHEKYCFIPHFKEFYILFHLINYWNVITNEQYLLLKNKNKLHSFPFAYFLPSPPFTPQCLEKGYVGRDLK